MKTDAKWKPAMALLLMALVFNACTKCEDETEPRFALIFTENLMPVKPVFAEVYGLGGKGAIQINLDDSIYYTPVSLKQDSSTFILKSANGTIDTLTVRYKRDFIYQSKSCGFRVKFSDYKSGKSTTFPAVQVVKSLNNQGIMFGGHDDVYEIRISL